MAKFRASIEIDFEAETKEDVVKAMAENIHRIMREDYIEEYITVEELPQSCEHSFVDCDNEGCYGDEECRFCGLRQPK